MVLNKIVSVFFILTTSVASIYASDHFFNIYNNGDVDCYFRTATDPNPDIAAYGDIINIRVDEPVTHNSKTLSKSLYFQVGTSEKDIVNSNIGIIPFCRKHVDTDKERTTIYEKLRSLSSEQNCSFIPHYTRTSYCY